MQKTSILVLLAGFLFFTSTDIFAQRKAVRSRAANSAAKSRRPRTFEEAANQANALNQKGSYAEAFASAEQAIKLNSEDYRGYYYAAFSLFKRDSFDEARQFIEQAKEHATADGIADVNQLADNIDKGKTGSEQLQQAERYAAGGDTAKAANAYGKAYENLPDRDDIGLKAARLYGDQLNKPEESIQILKQILLRTQNADTTRTASAMIEKSEAAISAEKDRRAAEERHAAEERRAAERERAREEAERADREKQTLEQKRGELEAQRSEMEGKIDSEAAAERDEESAEYYANEQAKYAGMQYGQVSASIASVAKDRAASSAKRHRAQVRDWQSKLRDIERQLASVERDLSRINY